MGGGGGFAYFENFYSLKTALSSSRALFMYNVMQRTIPIDVTCT